MDGEMHIFYLFTPIHTASDISWPVFRDELKRLGSSDMRAFRRFGVHPGFVNSGAELKESTPEEISITRMYRGAYGASQLRNFCNEIPIHDIQSQICRALRFSTGAGPEMLGFAAGMIKFCERMGWDMLVAALDHTVDQLCAGGRADLLLMAQVAFVKSRLAGILLAIVRSYLAPLQYAAI